MISLREFMSVRHIIISIENMEENDAKRHLIMNNLELFGYHKVVSGWIFLK